MRKLIMCVGLPGSGKTTWAVDEVVRNYPQVTRVNQDDIRKQLGWLSWKTWDFKGEREKQVHTIKEQRIREGLNAGLTVISDDTNLGRKRKSQLEGIARECHAAFEVKRFDTPIEECIRRDAARSPEAQVGEQVIHRMATQYNLLPAQADGGSFTLKVQAQPELMPAIICDLDGTLSLNKDADGKQHRSFYDATGCSNDIVNPAVLKTIRCFHRAWVYQIIYLSGRFERHRAETQEFFNKNSCPPGPLYMRKDGDTRKDYIVKGELFDAHVRGKYNVVFVLDDRNQVVDYWRRIGLTCFQVAPGDF